MKHIQNTRPVTQLDYREIDVTPEIAREWLELNKKNRKFKPGQISAFSEDMSDGRWALTGEAIKFAGPWESPTLLLDGQNRLRALLRSGRTATMTVVFKVDPKAQSAMDSGTKRTVADNLTIDKRQNASTVASAAAIAVRVSRGKLNGGPLNATNRFQEEWIEEHPSIEYSAAIARKYATRADVAPSFVAYTHWVLSKIDPEDADKFWRDAAEKVGLEAGDPILAMTIWFAQARRQNVKVMLATALSIIYRTWNYRRQGKTLSIIKTNSPSGGVVPIPEKLL